MRFLSSVGLGLSLVFGCLLLALVAELYYFLWWKKRITNREIEDDYSSPAKEILHIFCWKKPSSSTSTALNPQELTSSSRFRNTHFNQETEHQIHGDTNSEEEEEDDESEFLKLYDLSGPPRFLFTIKEETKEDLESEQSKKGSRTRSLSDLAFTVETPFLTPLSSPPFLTPPLTPLNSSLYYNNGFNPLYESSTDAIFNKIRSSPPPKFKFLQDAEDKLHRRILKEEEEKRVQINKDGEDGSFIAVIVAKNKEQRDS